MGLVYCFSASIMLAISTVFAHYITKGLNPLVIVLYSFSISFVFFNITGVKDKSFFKLAKTNWKWVIWINLSTAIDWLLIFISLEYISAALINCFVFGAAPIATLFLSLKSYNRKRVLVKDSITCGLIAMLLVLLSIIYYHNNTISFETFIYGVILSAISGLATGGTVYGGKQLQIRGFSTNAVMRSRFLATIIMALIMIGYNSNISFSINPIDLLNIVVLSFLFVIIPTFLLQKGIERTVPVMAAIITSLIPALTYIFQIFEPGFTFYWQEMIVILALSFVVFIAAFIKQ